MCRDRQKQPPPTAPTWRSQLFITRQNHCNYFNAIDGLQHIVHNHPSGDPTPSHADVQMTQQIIAVASPLGISVHDHIIVGKEGHASLKGLQLI
jgi:hypothetical protein